MLKPSPTFRYFIVKTLLVMGFLSLERLIFYVFNSNFFSAVGIIEFFQGFRFDAVATAYGLLPVYVIMVAFFPIVHKPRVQKFINYYTISIIVLFTALNLIDTIYFRFTLKRSTWDLLNFISTGDDALRLIPRFLVDFWYIFVLFFLLTFLAIKMNRMWNWKSRKASLLQNLFFSTIILFISVVGARGGLQLKPLNIQDASRYSNGQNVPLLLSTPFTMMKTVNSEHLKPLNYFDNQRVITNYFNPHIILAQSETIHKKNIIILVMESLSREYVGQYNEGKGFTPFLDSLMGKSLVFRNAYANGKRSIEALPAIFSALPNLMNEAYRTSPYAGNQLQSLASILRGFNYTSHFFHGGRNGTMGFDSYTVSAGFDNYYGLDQYPSKNDFDGNWGIYDIPYFKYVARFQAGLKQPFMCGIFSLSAHHPYSLPAGYQGNCPAGPLPIHKTVCYSDDALRHYFKIAATQPWYQESVFLITADHTAQSASPKYKTTSGIYAIPLIIFDPSNPNGYEVIKTTQQADITPTLLNYLGFPVNMIAFGQSAIDTNSKGMAVNYLNGLYQLIEDDHIILFDGQHVVAAFASDENGTEHALDNNMPAVLESEKKLKSIIQQYNKRLVENDLLPSGQKQ
ncbi:MAG: sulfatase-like hydrolase/transferase [Vicingaceae bacterium]